MQAVSAGLLAGFVGFASSFAVVLQGLAAVGASPAEAASGLMALSITMGVAGILLSLKLRLPISVAWSTPGGALLAATAAPSGGFAEAVGAFLVWRRAADRGGAVEAAGPRGRRHPGAAGQCHAGGHPVHPLPRAGAGGGRAAAGGPRIVLAWAVVARVTRVLAVPPRCWSPVAVIAMSVPLPQGVPG